MTYTKVTDLRSNIQALQAMVKRLREINSTLSVGALEMFLLVAMNEGASMTELLDKTGTKKPTGSRYLMDLSDKRRDGSRGYGLVSRDPDPSDYRRNQYTLTKKGRDVLALLSNTQRQEEQ